MQGLRAAAAGAASPRSAGGTSDESDRRRFRSDGRTRRRSSSRYASRVHRWASERSHREPGDAFVVRTSQPSPPFSSKREELRSPSSCRDCHRLIVGGDRARTKLLDDSDCSNLRSGVAADGLASGSRRYSGSAARSDHAALEFRDSISRRNRHGHLRSLRFQRDPARHDTRISDAGLARTIFSQRLNPQGRFMRWYRWPTDVRDGAALGRASFHREPVASRHLATYSGIKRRRIAAGRYHHPRGRAAAAEARAGRPLSG